MLRGRFYKKTVFKWIVSLAVFISATVAVISVSLFNWYNSDSIRQYSQATEATLLSISESMGLYDQALKSTGFLTAHDDDVVKMMTSSAQYPMLHTTLQQKLITLIFTNQLIDSAYLVNKKAGWVIGSPHADWVEIDSVCGFITDEMKRREQDAIVRIDTHKDSVMGRPFLGDDVVSYVFFRTRGSTGDDSFLILNVRIQSLSRLLFSRTALEGSAVMVTDEAGRAVFAGDPQQLYGRYAEQEYFKKAAASSSPSGYFTYRDANSEYLVTYVRSESLHYCFISLTPYDTVRQTSIDLRNRTILLSVVILAAGLGIAAVLSLYFYSPLSRLMRKYYPEMGAEAAGAKVPSANEYELLDELIERRGSSATTLARFLDESLPIVKRDFLINIIEGKISLENSESRKRLNESGIRLERDTLQIVYIQIVAGVGEGIDMPALRGRVVKAAESYMQLVCPCQFIGDWKDDAVVALLNYDSGGGNIETGILTVFRSLQEHAAEHLGAALTVAFGKPTESDVHGSYSGAVELLAYRVKYGDGALITDERVSADIAGYDLFPEKEERQLLKGLRALSVEACSQAIRKLVKDFYGYSIGDILRAMNHILYSTYQVAGELLRNKDSLGEFDYFIAYEQITKYRTLTELEDNLILLCEGIIGEINASSAEEGDGVRHIIRTVTAIVTENYHNSMLSLEFVANQVNLSPSYLGKIFKEQTNLFFTEYVNNLRIGKAKELLLNTDESVNRISALVGYNSSAYFVTTFRKTTGLTPARFRETGKPKQ